MREKLNKMKRSFTIPRELFIQLKLYAVKKNIPYSIIIEAIIDIYLKNPENFEIDFSKYK